MKTRDFFTRLFLCTTLFFPLVLCAAQATGDNLAALDQLLANVQPDQKLVTIGDMQFLASELKAFRNQLAGTPSPQSAFDAHTPTWPGGNVYYEFSTNVPANLQKAFVDAAGEWAMFANLHFIARTTQTNYVTVQVDPSLEGGQSAVGMIGGQQFLSISPNAWNRGTLCHEIGHTLGLIHEHQRSDRDSFVTIVSNNVVTNGLANFVIVPDSLNQGAYDFLSVMHYARNYLSASPNLDTIVPLPAYTQFINLMGVPGAVTLSDGDRAGMAAVYGTGPIITSVVTNTLDSGAGSLRAALYYAFDHPGTTITFNISTNDPGYSNGVFVIQPSDQLPGLVNATTIEGASQLAASTNAAPVIVINGALPPVPGTFANGLHFSGTNCTAHGLIINGFAASDILMDGTNTTGNIVAGCYLGIDAAGNIAVSNGLSPVTITAGAHDNFIGGIAASNRNIISGGQYQGVAISQPGTHGNVIEGNYIGLNAAGTAAVRPGNGFAGVEIFSGAQSNIIGGTIPGARNVISGNNIQGIAIDGIGTIGNVVEGNYIGLTPAGTLAISNGFDGIEIFGGAQSNIIGARNIISGNNFAGIGLDGAGTTGNRVLGNYIGLSVSGSNAIFNAAAGVSISDAAQSNIIGGIMAAERNIISGNVLQGVAISGADTTGNIVMGNYIGLDPTGSTGIPNDFPGVNLFSGAHGNIIGGPAPGAGNVISGNYDQGVSLQDDGTLGNTIQGNIIGLDATGAYSIPNMGGGMELFFNANQNIIDRNILSGNYNDGLLLDNGASSNVVTGNFLGLDATGLNVIGNGRAGVEMFLSANGNVVGGIGGRNYISGNPAGGVIIDDGAFFNRIEGNTIGLNIAGSEAPNVEAGVVLFGGAQSNNIGGVLPGQANIIAGNTGYGVEINEFSAGDTTNNPVRGNSIFDNASGTGIALFSPTTVSPPQPTLAVATLTTNLAIPGSLSGCLPLTTYQVDFYANPNFYLAQAVNYIGEVKVTTAADGSASFTAHLNAIVPVDANYRFTATITDPSGNTSMLSPPVTVSATSSLQDGIPDAWRAVHFSSATTTNDQSCATCDPDHDSLSNLQEFLAGTDPNDPASTLRIGSVAPNGADLTVTFPSVQGIAYRVEYKNDLASPGWTLLADQVLGTGASIQLTDPNAAGFTHRYYRMEVLP